MLLKKYPYYLSSIWKLLFAFKPTPVIIQFFLNIEVPEQISFIEVKRAKLIFKVRSAMDIWSIKETFLDRFYERYGTTIADQWVIIDIGGGIGDFAIFAATHHPQNRVITFEPTPDSFTTLETNIRLNNIGNVEAFQKAIWSSSDKIVMNTLVGEPIQFNSQSFIAGNVTDDQFLVDAITLQEVFERMNIDKCSLMKIDCEGAEYEILLNTPDSILERIERIVMEYHEGVTPYSHTDLEQFLTKRGFSVKAYPNFVHEDLGYLYATQK